MRFQVQWGTGEGKKERNYSAVRDSTDPPGVTVAEAISGLDEAHRKVAEKDAQEASRDALAKQKDFVRRAAPSGLGDEGKSKSAYFDLEGFTDAGVDVENSRGHNLKE